MSGYVFFKKEVKAIFKTYRIWLIPLIFIFFGILSPVSAKFLPAILKAAMQADTTQKVFLQIKIPEPTQTDAYLQWVKNLSQFGMLTLILISMGLVAEEKARGTLALVVTKPVSNSFCSLWPTHPGGNALFQHVDEKPIGGCGFGASLIFRFFHNSRHSPRDG